MHYRVPLFVLLLGAPAASSCFQELDTGAAKGSGLTPEPSAGGGGSGTSIPPRGGGGSGTPAAGGGGGTPGGGGGTPGGGGGTAAGGSAGIGGAGGTGTAPDAGPPPEPEPAPDPLFRTPGIEFVTPEGETTETAVPCEATIAHAATIVLEKCASCHGGRNAGERQGQPPFDYILDNARLIAARSASVPDPTAPAVNRVPGTPNFQGMRFVIPGDPDNSRFYFRVTHKEMPPVPVVGVPDTLVRPTVSDFSVLREWILNCIEEPEPDPGDGGTGGNDGGDPGAGPDGGTAALRR